jgi:hypothetical protein
MNLSSPQGAHASERAGSGQDLLLQELPTLLSVLTFCRFQSKNEMTNNPGQVNKLANLNAALERSERELIHLANYYDKRGYHDEARELYRTIFKIRAAKNYSEKQADAG